MRFKLKINSCPCPCACPCPKSEIIKNRARARTRARARILRITFILLTIFNYATAEDPWGKDSDLAYYKPQPHFIPCQKKQYTPILSDFAEIMISFHQNVISPADGPRSHFLPSSSQYARDAIRKYGFFKGFC